jgi:hypothetical protein
MDDEPRIIRSASIAALIRIMDNALGRIVYLHQSGENAEASARLSFVEGILLHALALVQAMKLKVDDANGPLTEADADAFAEQLASMPDAAEPPNG